MRAVAAGHLRLDRIEIRLYAAPLETRRASRCFIKDVTASMLVSACFVILSFECIQRSGVALDAERKDLI